MKNPRREALRRLAKQYHRHHPECFGRGGILTYHRYEGLDPGRLTWWDDFAFVLNDYRVSVAWTHPRMAFQDRLKDIAMEQVEHQWADTLNSKTTPEYRKLGKSRKKVVRWCINSDGADDRFSLWVAAFEKEVARLADETDLRIQPTMKAYWTRRALVVNLCAPVEVRDEADIRRLAELIRRLLKQETILSREFPDYVYGRQNFAEEGIAADRIDLLHSHRMA